MGETREGKKKEKAHTRVKVPFVRNVSFGCGPSREVYRLFSAGLIAALAAFASASATASALRAPIATLAFVVGALGFLPARSGAASSASAFLRFFLGAGAGRLARSVSSSSALGLIVRTSDAGAYLTWHCGQSAASPGSGASALRPAAEKTWPQGVR